MTSLALYYASGACSFVPHVLLENSGAAFEPRAVKLHKGEQKSPEYLATNPRGQVPVLVQDGQVLTQIVAIVLHLDQLFPGVAGLPTEPMARSQALSRLAWMNNTVHPTFTHIFKPQAFTDSTEAQASVRAHNLTVFRGLLAEIQGMVQAAQASGQAWLGSERIGALDAYALTFTRWGSMVGIRPDAHPDLWAHVQRVAAHPAVARVIERERLQLDMSPRTA